MMKTLKAAWPRMLLAIGLALVIGLAVPRLGLGAIGLAIGLAATLAVVFLTVRDPFAGLLAITFLLPFERVGSVEVAGFTLRASQVVGALLIVVFLLGLVLKRGGRVRSPGGAESGSAGNPTIWFGAAFLIIALVSISQAVNPFRAVTVFAFVAFTVIVSWLIPHLVTDREKLRRVVVTLFLSAVLVGAFGLYQFAGDLVGLPPSLTGLRDLYTSEVFGFPRVQSTFLEPLYYANWLLIPMMLAVSFLLASHRFVRPVLLVGLVLLAGVNFVLTLSRGGYIALAVAALALFAVYWKKVLAPHRLLLGLLIAAAVVWGAVQFLGLTGDRTESVETFTRQATGLFTGASYTDRATTFEDAWVMFQTHPILGVGIGNFGPNVAQLPLVQPDSGWLIVNNEFLELLAETGVLGFSAIVLLLIALFIRSIRAIRSATDPFVRAVLIGLLAAFVGVVVQYQTFSILYIMHVWFLFGLMVAAQNVAMQSQKAKGKIENEYPITQSRHKDA